MLYSTWLETICSCERDCCASCSCWTEKLLTPMKRMSPSLTSFSIAFMVSDIGILGLGQWVLIILRGINQCPSLNILLSSTPRITAVVRVPLHSFNSEPLRLDGPRTVEPQPSAFEQYTRELDTCQHGFYACQATSYPTSHPWGFGVTPLISPLYGRSSRRLLGRNAPCPRK